jgi:hypothetical protein
MKYVVALLMALGVIRCGGGSPKPTPQEKPALRVLFRFPKVLTRDPARWERFSNEVVRCESIVETRSLGKKLFTSSGKSCLQEAIAVPGFSGGEHDTLDLKTRVWVSNPQSGNAPRLALSGSVSVKNFEVPAEKPIEVSLRLHVSVQEF